MYKHILLFIFTSSLILAEEYPTVCLEQEGTCYKGSWLKVTTIQFPLWGAPHSMINQNTARLST